MIKYWPCNGCKAALSRHHHIVVPAGAVDDEHISVAVKSEDDADMAVSRIEHKVSRLGIAPRNFGAIAVLTGRSTTVADDVTTICGVIEYPIDE